MEDLFDKVVMLFREVTEREAVAAYLAVASVAALIFLAVRSQPIPGELVAITVAAVGWYLRGRVQDPS